MAKLQISPDLALPIEAVTEALGFLGRRGSGKSYAAQKLAEEFHRAGAQFVALDPVGNWWGLRLAANGKDPGIAIPVFGGMQGDVPLEPTAGALIADVIVDRSISAVVDVSQFESDADKARFARAFCERFYFRKKSAPSAVHLFLEEAQEFVPQNPQGDETLMLHAFTRLAKLGRNFGIGISLISQRPQEVNKKVLNLAELLFVFQLTGVHERKAVEAWIGDKGIEGQDIDAELPKLTIGRPHAWSPGWLKVSRVISIGEKRTYDASSTPKVGARQAEQKPLAPIDLEKLRTDMAATIERAKAEDPKELRREIASLRSQLTKAQRAAGVPTERTSPRIDPAVIDAAVARAIGKRDQEFEAWNRRRAQAVLSVVKTLEVAGTAITQSAVDLRQLSEIPLPTPATNGHGAGVPARSPLHPKNLPPAKGLPRRSASEPSEGLSGPQQRILDTLAGFEAAGIVDSQKNNVAVFSGASPTSSSFGNNLGVLRSAGLIDYPIPGVVELTDAGRKLARASAINSTEELHASWESKLSGPQWRILETLIDVHPESIGRTELANKVAASETSSSYGNNLGALRSLGLIEYRPGKHVAATDLLFPAGLA